MGLLATISPCVLAVVSGFSGLPQRRTGAAGSRRRYFLGFFVLAGVLVMMLALGALIALLSIPVGAALRWVVPLSDAIIIGLGVLLILNINPFKALPQIRDSGAAASLRQRLCVRAALRADDAALLRPADRQHLRAVAVCG